MKTTEQTSTFNTWEVTTGTKGYFKTYKRHYIPTSKNPKEELKDKNILMTKLINR